ncbi:MAG TPA: hypothetical protein VFA70_14870 [Dehalococcoidia bacterium]|nr:hypothetical protein [Dehalococcoidia bacterium]
MPSVPPAWTTYTSSAARISFRYDPGWHLAECDPGQHYSWGTVSGPQVTIMIGDTSADPSSCPPENESPHILLEAAPRSSPPATMNPEACGGSVGRQSVVTIDGVSATRQVIDYPTYAQCIGAPITSEIRYSLSTGGEAYVFDCAYRQDGGSDLEPAFDILVQETLRFLG